jgi:F-type H+-transporting ATPase subunit b
MDEGLQLFKIDPGLFIWALITFLILVGLLYKFAFNPLMKMQKARQDSINQAIDDAERLRGEADELLAEYKQKLTDARTEAENILDRARKAGEATKTGALEEARLEAEKTLARARQQIERDTNQALQKIREEVADLTVAATEKVARSSLSGEDQLRLIQKAIDEIDLSKVGEG